MRKKEQLDTFVWWIHLSLQLENSTIVKWSNCKKKHGNPFSLDCWVSHMLYFDHWFPSSIRWPGLRRWASVAQQHCFLLFSSCPGWTCIYSAHSEEWWIQSGTRLQPESDHQHEVCSSRKWKGHLPFSLVHFPLPVQRTPVWKRLLQKSLPSLTAYLLLTFSHV